jgi:sirohydrochlorin cobaltochelatase
VSALAQESALRNWLAAGLRCIGQIAIECRDDGSFRLVHRDDTARNDLAPYGRAEDAAELARFDDGGNYRPLKTAPNLRHGWGLTLSNMTELRTALDLFYPGRLAVFFAFEKHELVTTPLRETLDRQSGMYRIAAQIDDSAGNELVGNFCRSDAGCLRTILWRRDIEGTVASTRLPSEKFDPIHDQTGGGRPVVPLLCQEACGLVIAAAREVVQANRDVSSERP